MAPVGGGTTTYAYYLMMMRDENDSGYYLQMTPYTRGVAAPEVAHVSDSSGAIYVSGGSLVVNLTTVFSGVSRWYRSPVATYAIY